MIDAAWCIVIGFAIFIFLLVLMVKQASTERSHVCGDANHEFFPRYEHRLPEGAFGTTWPTDPKIVESAKTDLYVCDVCRYCGAVVGNNAQDDEEMGEE